MVALLKLHMLLLRILGSFKNYVICYRSFFQKVIVYFSHQRKLVDRLVISFYYDDDIIHQLKLSVHFLQLR